MPTEKVINGVVYRTGQLNAKEQFHIARRLAPIVAAMAMDVNLGAAMFQSLAEAVKKLDDADVDFIMRTTMKTVLRQVGDRWAPTWNVQADIPQFADMNAAMLTELMMAVIEDQLGGFTDVLVGPGPGQLATAQNGPLN